MKYLYTNKHWSINKEYNIDKLLYLMIDRPNYINIYNSWHWKNNKNEWHRDYDLPSFVYQHNDKIYINIYWYKNNERHRENNKPAVIKRDGYKEYYING